MFFRCGASRQLLFHLSGRQAGRVVRPIESRVNWSTSSSDVSCCTHQGQRLQQIAHQPVVRLIKITRVEKIDLLKEEKDY